MNDLESIVRKSIEARNLNQLDVYIQMFNEKSTVETGAYGKKSGLNEIRELYKKISSQTTGHHFEIINLLVEENRVAAEVIETGIYLPTNRQFRIRMAIFYFFEGNEIVLLRTLQDNLDFARQVGKALE